MDIIVTPGSLSGTISAIPSKSIAHRYFICAAFSDKVTKILYPEPCEDVSATIRCLNALGANIQRDNDIYTITPIKLPFSNPQLLCGDSGSTLRFLLPVVGALGINATFILSEALSKRPITPLCEEMERMGCTIQRNDNQIICSGKLQPGAYTIPGNISSQFISGLLFAMALIDGACCLTITEELQSSPYIELTKSVLSEFGIQCDNLTIRQNSQFLSPGHITVEGDWSNAAFFLAANALGSNVQIDGLNMQSLQGDRQILKYLSQLSARCDINAAHIPDLVPILSVIAAANQGAIFHNITRLRLKESDRIRSTIQMLNCFGIKASFTNDTLIVQPGKFHSCIINPCNDHRIAMSAAIAAIIADGDVTIQNADCVNKSYPAFWQDFEKLGGNYEQHLR